MEYFEPNISSGLARIESPDTSHSLPSPQGRKGEFTALCRRKRAYDTIERTTATIFNQRCGKSLSLLTAEARDGRSLFHPRRSLAFVEVVD